MCRTPFRRLATALAALLVFGMPARGADLPCSSLLEGNVLDLRDTRLMEQRIRHVRDVLCRREYTDIADYRRLNDMAGGSLDRALGAFGFRGDGMTWQLAREQMCSPRTRLAEKLKPYAVELRSADRGLMTAFHRCLPGTKHVELWVEADPTDIARWRISAFNRNPQADRAPKFRGLSTAPEKDLCQIESGFVAGQVFREDRAVCHHAQKGATVVTVLGDRPIGQVSITVPR